MTSIAHALRLEHLPQVRVIAESIPVNTLPYDASRLMNRYADDTDEAMAALPGHYRLAMRQRLSRLVLPPPKPGASR